MSGTIVFNAPRRLVFIRFSGVLTEHDVNSAAERIQAEAAIGKDFDRIISLLDVTEVAVSSAALRQLAEKGRIPATGRRAIIATTPLIFGLARMFQQNFLLPEGTTGVFPDLAGALEFLGLDPSITWPDAPVTP